MTAIMDNSGEAVIERATVAFVESMDGHLSNYWGIPAAEFGEKVRTSISAALAAAKGSDMTGVGDFEDCARCAGLDEPCGFHHGYDVGYAAAFALVGELVADPETFHVALERRERQRANGTRERRPEPAQNGAAANGSPRECPDCGQQSHEPYVCLFPTEGNGRGDR